MSDLDGRIHRVLADVEDARYKVDSPKHRAEAGRISRVLREARSFLPSGMIAEAEARGRARARRDKQELEAERLRAAGETRDPRL